MIELVYNFPSILLNGGDLHHMDHMMDWWGIPNMGFWWIAVWVVQLILAILVCKDAEIDITELTSEEIQLETLVDISNPNTFDLILKNVKIASETKDGDEFTRYSFKGGDVPSNEKNLLISETQLIFFFSFLVLQ